MGSIPVSVIFCLLEVVRKLVGCADCHARPSLTTTFFGGQRPERRKLRPNVFRRSFKKPEREFRPAPRSTALTFLSGNDLNEKKLRPMRLTRLDNH